MKTKVIGVFKPPSDMEFKVKTEISQVAIYPIYDKDDKKIVDKMQLNLTVHLTVWLSGFLLNPITKIIKQEISTEEMNELINHLKTKFDMETNVNNTTEPQHDAKLLVMRCGDCLFAEGGKTVKFKNGKTNELYDCTLKSRNGNIVLLDSDISQPVWHNSIACQHFEIMSKTLKKRADLDKEKYHFACDGHFEILP